LPSPHRSGSAAIVVSSSPLWDAPVMPVAAADRTAAEPGSGHQHAGASGAHEWCEDFLDGDACDMRDHATSPPLGSVPAAARATRSCTRPGRSASVVSGSSCQIHHSYGGLCG